MSKYPILLAFCLCAVAALVGCKPTEQNYRAAYDRAIAARDSIDAEDPTVYNAIRREMKQRQAVYDGDTIEMRSQHVAITENGGGIAEWIKPYCVVAGQFKQAFNARSMRERMVELGYPGAFVVQTREPYYFVVAESYTDIKPAVEMLERLKGDEDLKLRAPLPFILQPAQIMR